MKWSEVKWSEVKWSEVKWSVPFYINGSLHRDSVLIRSNKMQQYAGIYLL